MFSYFTGFIVQVADLPASCSHPHAGSFHLADWTMSCKAQTTEGLSYCWVNPGVLSNYPAWLMHAISTKCYQLNLTWELTACCGECQKHPLWQLTSWIQYSGFCCRRRTKEKSWSWGQLVTSIPGKTHDICQNQRQFASEHYQAEGVHWETHNSLLFLLCWA